MNKSKAFVHPSSFVDQGARVGEGTQIWHFTHILKGARIGKNCKIGQNVVVLSTAVIGDHVKIQNNVSVYDGVVLEDYVFCGPSCVFTNVINPRSGIARNAPEFYKKTFVRYGVTIGANATIVCGIEIGRFAFIGAGAVVTRDVPAYALVYGNPARQRGWMCECGEKIKFVKNKAWCVVCRRGYEKEKGIVRPVNSNEQSDKSQTISKE